MCKFKYIIRARNRIANYRRTYSQEGDAALVTTTLSTESIGGIRGIESGDYRIESRNPSPMTKISQESSYESIANYKRTLQKNTLPRHRKRRTALSIESKGWVGRVEGDNSSTGSISDSRSDSRNLPPMTEMSRDSGYSSMASKQLLKRQSNDSDAKSITSLESHISYVSSLNPTDVGGVAEQLAEVLWNSEEIQRCVKLGFVVMDSTRFERNFLRLIKIYASELRAEADTAIQKGATRIVQNYGAYVTRIIRRRVIGDDSQASAFHGMKDQTASKLMLERFLEQQSTGTADQADSRPEDEQESNGDIHSDDEYPYLPNLEKLTDFLVSSTAFKNFRAQLEVFVESNSQLQQKQTLEGSPSESHIRNEHAPIEQVKKIGFLRRAKNFFRRSLRRPILPGSQRVEWICVGLSSNSFWELI